MPIELTPFEADKKIGGLTHSDDVNAFPSSLITDLGFSIKVNLINAITDQAFVITGANSATLEVSNLETSALPTMLDSSGTIDTVNSTVTFSVPAGIPSSLARTQADGYDSVLIFKISDGTNTITFKEEIRLEDSTGQGNATGDNENQEFAYTPSNPADWSSQPTKLREALDLLASQVATGTNQKRAYISDHAYAVSNTTCNIQDVPIVALSDFDATHSYNTGISALVTNGTNYFITLSFATLEAGRGHLTVELLINARGHYSAVDSYVAQAHSISQINKDPDVISDPSYTDDSYTFSATDVNDGFIGAPIGIGSLIAPATPTKGDTLEINALQLPELSIDAILDSNRHYFLVDATAHALNVFNTIS